MPRFNLSDEQYNALIFAREYFGMDCWKRKLRECWEKASYPANFGNNSAVLQHLRNQGYNLDSFRVRKETIAPSYNYYFITRHSIAGIQWYVENNDSQFFTVDSVGNTAKPFSDKESALKKAMELIENGEAKIDDTAIARFYVNDKGDMWRFESVQTLTRS